MRKNIQYESLRRRLSETAKELVQLVRSKEQRIVFAESCTGGRMASSVTEIPGVSSCFCGSAVTYRYSTKSNWLSVDEVQLEQETAESKFATEAMAKGVLDHTPESNWSIAITGHLGPSVDPAVDGFIFVAVAEKNEDNQSLLGSSRFQLVTESRVDRQTEAACIAFEYAIAELGKQR